MTPSPRISVVLIFLDAERFLDEAIESVLAQTYPNWELLLVDDGSSDRSSEIARRYETARPDQIRYLHHPRHENRGMSASRNLGIAQASGAFIGFLDADDVFLPEELERQAERLAAVPEAAMVYGPTLHWHGWTGTPEDGELDHPRKMGVELDTLVQPPELVRRFLRRDGWPPVPSGILARRTAVEAVGGFEERFRGLFEDQAFVYKLCLRSPVYVHSGAWELYRQHAGSACERARERGEWHPRAANPAHRDFLVWLEAYLDDNGIDDTVLRRAVRARLRPYRRPRLHRVIEAALRIRGIAHARAQARS